MTHGNTLSAHHSEEKPQGLVSTVLRVTPKPDVKIIRNLDIFIARTLAEKAGVGKARHLDVKLGPDEVFTVRLNGITSDMRHACITALREEGYGVTDTPQLTVVAADESDQEEVA